MQGQQQTPPVPEDLTSTVWRDDNFFQHFELNQHTVLDYFAASPFYDSQCNNEECRRRGLPLDALQCAPRWYIAALAHDHAPPAFQTRKVLLKPMLQRCT